MTNREKALEEALRRMLAATEGSHGDHPAHIAGHDAISIPAPSAWQPMETAPKDGTHVLLGYPGKNGYTKYGCYSGGEWLSAGGKVLTPTAWMPLPTPPSSEKL